MNREIKFRAWNGTKMLFMHNAEFYLNISAGVQIPSSTGHEFYDKDYPVMQYTGLKGKNGKEIYEGDIYTHNDKKFVVITSVNYGICAIEVNKNLGDVLSHLTIKRNHNYRDFYDIRNIAKHIEVIGNIYEHPTLID